MAALRSLVITAAGKYQEAKDADTQVVSGTVQNGSGALTINAAATNLLLQVAGTTKLTVGPSGLISAVALAMGSNKVTGITEGTAAGEAITWSSKLAGPYGSGGSGAYTAPVGTTTANSELQATTVHIPSGATFVTNGYPIRATVSVTVDSGGLIIADGGDASTTTAGTGAPFAEIGSTTADGASGVLGSASDGYPGSGIFPGYGGIAGDGGSVPGHAGGTGGPPSAAGVHSALTSAHAVWYGMLLSNGTTYGINGGGGGGSGACNGFFALSGAGGGGGGVVYIAAPTVTNNGTIGARGGRGGDAVDSGGGSAGGGGGGGGGIVYVVTRSFSGTSPDVSGGAGGASTGAFGNPGIAGGAGTSIVVAP